MFNHPPRRRSLIPAAAATPPSKQAGGTFAERSPRRLLLLTAAAIVLIIAGYAIVLCYVNCCTAGSNNGHLVSGVGAVSHALRPYGTGPSGSSGVPPHPANRPHHDLVVAVLVVGGDTQDAQEEIARVRRVYARYGQQVVPDGGLAAPLTLRVVFVVGRAGLSEDVRLPETGLLLGDFFYLDVREGYRHLSDKTKAMMALSEHLSFRFLAKTDGDTFPCLARVTQQLIELPVEQQPRVYAGLQAKCGKVFPKGHKLHDPEFLEATGGVLDCHPMYHQGAFYILGEHIVRHLHRSRDLLTVMSVEDAMVGLWLLGIDKVMLDIGGQFYCQCFTHPVPQQKQSFYHFCKTEQKINGCLRKFGAC